MSKAERIQFCQLIKEVKFPDAYASNISRCIKEAKIFGLKSHDRHVLFQRIVPLIIKEILPKDAHDPLIEFSLFFNDLCSKELSMEKLDQLDKSIRVTLCKLERVFMPTFFDVMVHLAIHLANEAKLGGPVQFRWMYYIERFLRTLKGYVRNNYRVEGSIAEGQIAGECITLFSRYLSDMETTQNRPDRNSNSFNIDNNSLSIFSCHGKPLAGGFWTNLNTLEINQAHFYILQNCEEVRPWIEEHLEILTKENNRNVAKRHKEEFPLWFEKKVIQLKENGDNRITEELLILARPPDPRVFCYSGYILNGSRFRTMESELGLKTQNSGVVVKSDEHTGNIDYFGRIRRILEIQYMKNKSVMLFQCDWFEVPPQGRSQSRGYKKDEYGFVCVDITRLHYTNDPFILGSQAQSVYYVKHGQSEKWHSVIRKMSERNKNNKAKQEVNHICGRKTFQAVSYEARNTTTGKDPNFQKLWEITHMKPNGQWVTSASAEVNDKVKDVIAEKIQDIDEGTDVDPIINAAFVQIMGEKSKYILGKGSGIKSASRISRNEIQEQLRAQQKEAEEERYKRESVEIKLMEVKNQLEEERKNREVMEFRLVHDQKLLKESMMALVSHLKNPKNDLPASIFNIFTTSTTSNETSSACLMNNNWEDLHVKKNQESQMQKELDNLKDVLNFEKQNLEMAIYDCDKFNTLCNEKDVELKAALTEKQNLEMRLPKLSSQGSKKTTPKELVDANNQVFDKIHEELKARCMLRTAEETKKRLLSEKSSLEEKIVEIEKKKSSEDEHA